MTLTLILHGTEATPEGEHPRMLTLLAGILTFSTRWILEPGGNSRLNGNSTVRVQVGRGGYQAVAHVRLHTLGAFADRLGLGDVLSARIRQQGSGLRWCLATLPSRPRIVLADPIDTHGERA